MTLILRATVVSDLGLARGNNEDAAHVGPRLIAVADGIGGLPAGELASEIVIQALAGLELPPDDPEATKALRDAVDAANREIAEQAGADRAREGMGTTLTTLLLTGAEIVLLHVGDSRAYRSRDGELRQLSRDDTFVQGLVDQGVLTPEEARRHPRRSLVTKALQGLPVQPYCVALAVKAGDRYLLCSDGLSDVVGEEAIGQTLVGQSDLAACAHQLVTLALEAGGPDNVTTIVADVVEA